MSNEILPPSPLETFIELHGNHKLLYGRVDARTVRCGYVAAVRINPTNSGKALDWENPFGRRRYFASLAPRRIPELELAVGDEIRLYASDLEDDTVIPYDIANVTTGRAYFLVYHPSHVRHPYFDRACLVPPFWLSQAGLHPSNGDDKGNDAPQTARARAPSPRR